LRVLQKAVESIVKDTERDDDMVDRLIKLKTFAERTIEVAFVVDQKPAPFSNPHGSDLPAPNPPAQANTNFDYALRDAFQVGFKARRVKPAEMIAKYLDTALRKGQKGTSDADFDMRLERVLGLHQFTDDKDVFRTFYHRLLAKRLLLAKSASDDFEKAMLKKLQSSMCISWLPVHPRS
jgi:cullin-4